ncbi:MAG: chromosome partitioning protein ParB [Planctomycetes bacterium]|nr:chromosome partitioning protein ParB [Planctomycetota bacterium]
MIEGHVFTSVRRDQRMTWRVERLWELAKGLRPVEISLYEFLNYLDNDFWFTGERPTTRSVALHCRKINSADLKYPILLSAEGDLMDGMHRLAKAWMMEAPAIKTVRFPKTPPPDLVEDLPRS